MIQVHYLVNHVTGQAYMHVIIPATVCYSNEVSNDKLLVPFPSGFSLSMSNDMAVTVISNKWENTETPVQKI